MAAKLCKKLQILLGNNMKYSDFIDDKYFLRNWRLKWPHFSEKNTSSKKIYWYFFTEISDIGFYWYNKYAWKFSEKSLEQKSGTRKSFKI